MDRTRDPLPTRVQDTPTLPTGYDDALSWGLDDLGLELTAEARAVIAGHVRLLLAWTPAINLTALRDPATVALGHVVDSLAALAWLQSRGVDRGLDLGSGGGFPGLPVAAAMPTMAVTLLEPIAKKARFLAAVIEATGLSGRVVATNARAESLAQDRHLRASWPVVMARAVGATADVVELAFPLLEPGGSLLAWKRGDLTEELRTARRAVDALGGGTIEVTDVRVDGLRDHRLVVVSRSHSGRLPAAYPRDPAVRRHRPW